MQIKGHPAGQIRLATTYLRYKLVYSLAGQSLGIIFLLAGLILLLNGVVGKTSLVAWMMGLQIDVIDAPAGVVLALIGAVVMYVTRFKVDVKLGP